MLVEYFGQGGMIVYLLLTLNIIGMAVILLKFFEFREGRLRESETVKRIKGQIDSRFGAGHDSEKILQAIKGEVGYFLLRYEKYLPGLKMIATVAPLLGLLGTVWGILMSFQVISNVGLSDPALFAEGISKALVTTLAGLVVAIINHIGHQYYASKIDNWEVALEEKVLNLYSA